MDRDKASDLAVHSLTIPVEGLPKESDTTVETNVIVTQLSDEAQHKRSCNPRFARSVPSHYLWAKVEGGS
jgi:hypothetical protein